MPIYSFEDFHKQVEFFNSIKEDYLYNFSWRLNRPLVGPRTLQLSITTKCNLHCLMCSAWKLKEPELDIFYLKKIIDDTFKMGNLKEVLLTGGEALLRPEIFSLIKYVKDYYSEVCTILNTNGLLLTRKNIEKLIDVRLDNLSVSIDSPAPEINNALRGEGVLERVIEAINYVNAEKRRRNVQYPVLVACSVLMEQTLDTMYGMLDFCLSHNISSLVIQAYVPNVNMASANPEDKLWIHKDRLPHLRDVLNKIDAKKGKLPNFYIESPSEKIYNYFSGSAYTDKCYAGFTQVLLVGQVMQFICCGPQEKEEYKYLDTIDRDPINKLWFSEKANYIRDNIKRCRRNCAQFCSIRPSSDSVSDIHQRLIKQGNLFPVFRELYLLKEYAEQYPSLELNKIIDSDYILIKERLDPLLDSLKNLELNSCPHEAREYLLSDLKLLDTNLKNIDGSRYSLYKEICAGILEAEKRLNCKG